MLGSAVLATCCTVADPHRPGRARMRLASLVMLAAMLDVALVGAVLPLVWAVAVAVAGVWAVAAERGGSPAQAGLRAHRGVAAITMGALMVGHSGGGSGHGHAMLDAGLVVVAMGAVVVVGGVLLTVSLLAGSRLAGSRLAGSTRPRERLAALEPALMALAVGAMLAA